MERSAPSSCRDITEGHTIVSYGLNGDGDYELRSEYVCQPVEIANKQAWREIDRQIALSEEKVLAGRVSCLHFYMTANQMDVGLLARYSGQPRWKVRLHLMPFFFKRASAGTLQNYADLFKISTDDLVRGILRPPIYNKE